MKNIWKIALMLVCAVSFTACSDDDDNTPSYDPPLKAVSGVYVLSEGSYYSKLDGDLTSYDPATSKTANGVFASVNKRTLGGTANDGVVYGSKLYIANTDENVVEVVDAKTAKSVKQITLSGARRILPYRGNIYVTSFYGKSVVKIDTTNYNIVATAEVGDNPEGLAVAGNYLYVANSGYGYGNTISKINLSTFKSETTLTVPTNPVDIFADGSKLYLRTDGQYKTDFSGYEANPALYSMDADGKTTYIVDATIATLASDAIYTIDNNYYAAEKSYNKVTLSDNKVSKLSLTNEPYSPYTMAVNPINGDIYITSYNSKDYGGGYIGADYSSNGYCIRYDKAGSQLDQFVVGISAGTIIFF